MPAPATTGGGLMGYPTSIDSGQVQEMYVGSEDAVLAGGQTVLFANANNVLVYAFELRSNVSAATFVWKMGTTSAGHTNVALFTGQGILVPGSDSGALSNSGNAGLLMSFSYATPIPLSPGQYFMAIGSDNNTDDYQGVNALSGAGSTRLTRWRLSGNNMSAGAMPATLGTLSTSSSKMPGLALYFSNQPIA